MKKLLLIGLSCTICFSSFVGCSKPADEEKEVSYITMDSFDEKKSNDSTNEGLVATIYTTDEDALNLVNKEVNVKSITPEVILDELITNKVVPEKTQVLSFKTYVSDGEMEVGVLDFSEEFYNFNLGSGFESMMLDSVAKTYLENFELDQLKLLVNGNEYQSGHILFEKDDFFSIKDYK